MERVISHTVSVLSQEADATLRVEMTLTGVCHCPRQIISNTARCIPILLPPRSFLRVHRRPWKRDSCTRNEMEAVRVCVCVCVCVSLLVCLRAKAAMCCVVHGHNRPCTTSTKESFSTRLDVSFTVPLYLHSVNGGWLRITREKYADRIKSIPDSSPVCVFPPLLEQS